MPIFHEHKLPSAHLAGVPGDEARRFEPSAPCFEKTLDDHQRHSTSTEETIAAPFSSQALSRKPLPVKNGFVHLGEHLDPRTLKSWAPGDAEHSDSSTEADSCAERFASESRRDAEPARRGTLKAWVLWKLGIADSGAHRVPQVPEVPTSGPCPQDELCPRNAPSDHERAMLGCTGHVPSQMQATGGSEQTIPPATLPVKKRRKPHTRHPDLDAVEEATYDRLIKGDWKDGWALQLAKESTSGGKAVQRALQKGPQDVRIRILKEFQGEVWGMLDNAHANHVLKSAVTCFGEELAGYISEELRNAGCDAAKHQYGCRLVSEIVKRWNGEASRSLIGEVLTQSKYLWRVPFATYVFQEVLKHGTEDQRRQVVNALIDDFEGPQSEARRVIMKPTKKQIDCIYVVAEALATCNMSAQPLAETLVKDVKLLQRLCQRKFGFVLLKSLLQLQGPLMDKLRESLTTAVGEVAEDSLDDLTQRLKDSECEKCKLENTQCARCAHVVEKLASIREDLGSYVRDLPSDWILTRHRH